MKLNHILEKYDPAVCIMAIRAPEHAPDSLKADMVKAAIAARGVVSDPVKAPPKPAKKTKLDIRQEKRLLRDDGYRFIMSATDEEFNRSVSQMKIGKRTIHEIARKYQIAVSDITGTRRFQYIVRARQEVFYRLRAEAGFSLPHIGYIVGGKDHTTILHGIRKHADRHGLPVPVLEEWGK